MNRVPLIFICMLCAVTFECCEQNKIKLPSSDNTPPELHWTVVDNGTNTSTDYPANTIIHITVGKNYALWLKAYDHDGGVRFISMQAAHGGYSCVNGDNVTSTSIDYPSHQTNLSVAGDGTVSTYAFVLQNGVNFSWDCNEDYDFDGGSVTFKGQAGNYYGVTASAMIKFTTH